MLRLVKNTIKRKTQQFDLPALLSCRPPVQNQTHSIWIFHFQPLPHQHIGVATQAPSRIIEHDNCGIVRNEIAHRRARDQERLRTTATAYAHSSDEHPQAPSGSRCRDHRLPSVEKTKTLSPLSAITKNRPPWSSTVKAPGDDTP